MPDSKLTRVVEAFPRELAAAIHEETLQEVKVVRSEKSPNSERRKLKWYCGKPASEAEGHLFLGAAQETWDAIGGAPEVVLGRCIEQTLADHPDAKQLVAKTETSEGPHGDWAKITLEMSHDVSPALTLFFVLSPALEGAIEGVADAVVPTQPTFSTGVNASDLLSQVHVPVTVSFGGTQIRMKDLLNLSTGSVVELDQSLSDSVEIRANNCLIARGEVVAIDGYYGVRVLELVPSSGKGIR